MERYRKKDILGMVSTLIKANESICRAFNGVQQDLMEPLMQCQDAAIQIGTYLESFGSKYEYQVKLLEEYCENIYQISISLPDINMCHKLSKKIKRLLTEFQNHIRYEMPDDRKEIVFLPYKASMWDSLESVWEAAKSDENADVYVIPIPYYDKNPDGSFREEHYEGDLYPEYVPITDYKKYDFENCYPDMIFIHNAYDNMNYITSVHPFFYSDNLKKYTDQLIYIPYFIFKEVDPDNQEAEEEISHLCAIPGVAYADKIIVQSENIRQIYINILTKEVLKNTNTQDTDDIRQYWEEKIKALGSPKIDNVLKLKREYVNIPDTWANIINKPDGTRKKVVLYNTSISAFLQNDEKVLEKIDNVFQLFEKRKSEIAIIWRPHPLLESSLTSMKPELSETYKGIKEKYLKSGWGIYDNSQDLGRAVAISDAYYGDKSSVVQLYEKTGKVTMLQNMKVRCSAEEPGFFGKPLITENICQDGQDIWMTAFDYNALFRLKKEEMKPQLMGIFPGERFTVKQLFSSTALCNGKFYFAPYKANQIAEYDPNLGKFKKLNVPDARKEVNHLYAYKKFRYVVTVGDKVYFIPAYYPGILCYDTKTEEISCFDEWVDAIEGLKSGELAYFKGCNLDGSRLLLPCACADAVMIFDILTGNQEIVTVKSEIEKIMNTDFLEIDFVQGEQGRQILNAISDKEKIYLSDADRFFLEEKHIKDFRERIMGGFVWETPKASLAFLLDFLCSNENREQVENIERPNYGAMIYAALQEV